MSAPSVGAKTESCSFRSCGLSRQYRRHRRSWRWRIRGGPAKEWRQVGSTECGGSASCLDTSKPYYPPMGLWVFSLTMERNTRSPTRRRRCLATAKPLPAIFHPLLTPMHLAELWSAGWLSGIAGGEKWQGRLLLGRSISVNNGIGGCGLRLDAH